MDIVVLGAAGRTGRKVVERALADQHTVTQFVRNPEAASTGHERLRVAVGDVRDPDSLLEPLAGKDAVVSTLGIRGHSTTTVFSDGIRNVLAAMKAGGTQRIVTMSTAGLDVGALPIAQRLVAEYIVERILRNVYLDLARMEDELSLSGVDWTVVRCPRLTDGPGRGQYRVAVDGHLRKITQISRADVADYMLRHLADEDVYGRRVEIAG